MRYFISKQIVLLSVMLVFFNGYSQQNILFTYEPFDYTSDLPLNGQNGGQGWQSSWQITSYDQTNPAYAIGSAGTYMPVNNLEVQGSYAKGGYNYKNAGRSLNLNYYGNYINDLGIIGRNGTTIYMSAVLRKEVSNDNAAMIATNINANSYDASPFKFGFGYIGSTCNSGSNRYWGIALGTSCYVSNVPVIYGASTLIVAKITFGSTNTISLFIDPNISSGIEPSTANITQTTTSDISFKNIRLTAGGSETNQASFDELRIGSSFLSVVPTATDASQIIGGGPISGTSTWNLAGNVLGTVTSFIGSTDAADLKFKTNNQDRLIVTKDGKVGIGITTPDATATLHVNGLIKTTGLWLPTGASANKVLTSDATGNASWITLPVSSQWVKNDSNVSYVTGKVGIGTNVPQVPLHIAQSTNVLLKLQSNIGGVGNSAAVDFATTSANVSNARIAAVDMNLYNASLVFYTDGDGQSNTNLTERMRITETGNVGIGTTTPIQKLDISGNLVTDGLALSRNNTNRGSIFFANYGDNNHRLYNNQSNADGQGAWDGMKWNVQEGLEIKTGVTNPKSTFYLNSAGNVGIGTSIPTEKLEVNGTAKVNTLLFSDGSTMTTAGGSFNSSNLSISANSLSDNNAYISANGIGTGLIFETPNPGSNIGVPRIAITNTGRVGVGIANPASAFQVAGDIYMNKVNYTAYSQGYSSKFKFDDGDNESSDPLWISRYNTAYNITELRVNIGDDPNDYGNALDKFVVGVTNWADGLWQPKMIVDVSGNVRIMGKVLSQDIKVSLNPLTDVFPDYVFKKGYRLNSLKELETYIKKNKHLPEVPSAKDVENDGGIELGKMNVILLKKVEELTLYLLQQEKKNLDLENRVKQLEKQK